MVDLPSVGVCTLLQWLISVFNYVFWLHLAQLTSGVSIWNTVGHVFITSFWKEMNYQRNSCWWVLRRSLGTAGPWGFHWVITWRLQDSCGLFWAFLSSESRSGHKAWVSIPAVSPMGVKAAPSSLHPCCALVVTLSPLAFPTALGELVAAHDFPSLRNLCTLLTTIFCLFQISTENVCRETGISPLFISEWVTSPGIPSLGNGAVPCGVVEVGFTLWNPRKCAEGVNPSPLQYKAREHQIQLSSRLRVRCFGDKGGICGVTITVNVDIPENWTNWWKKYPTRLFCSPLFYETWIAWAWTQIWSCIFSYCSPCCRFCFPAQCGDRILHL